MKDIKQWILAHKWIVLCAVVGVLLIYFGSASSDSRETETLDVRVEAYTKQLEEKITKMLSELEDVHDVHVLLTLEGSASYIYATDTDVGGKDYVVMNDGNGQTPILLQELLSEVRGVSVVCKNGEKPEVQRKIIGVLSTGLGIPSSRIFVAGS